MGVAGRIFLAGLLNIATGWVVISGLAGVFMQIAEQLTGAKYGWPQIAFMSAYPDHIRNGYLMFVAAVFTFIILSSGVLASVFGASPWKALFGIQYVSENGDRASSKGLFHRMSLILLSIGFLLLAGPILGFVFGPKADSFSLLALGIGSIWLAWALFPMTATKLSWVNRISGLRPALRNASQTGAS